MATTPTKAIIFDCFGVVISDALTLMVNKFSETRPQEAEEVRYLVGLSNRGLMDTEKAHREVAGLMGVSYDQYQHQIQHGEIKDHELLDYIKDLRGRYKTALLSNISPRGLELRFRPGELEQYFDVAIASGSIGYAKPEPEAYQAVTEQLGVTPEECIFIDDIKRYCDGAEALGMRTICYTDFTSFKQQFVQLLSETA